MLVLVAGPVPLRHRRRPRQARRQRQTMNASRARGLQGRPPARDRRSPGAAADRARPAAPSRRRCLRRVFHPIARRPPASLRRGAAHRRTVARRRRDGRASPATRASRFRGGRPSSPSARRRSASGGSSHPAQRGARGGDRAAATLGVSGYTIRRDLDELAELRHLQRVHGGALGARPSRPRTRSASHQSIEGKQAVARAAATLLEPGQTVIVDGGSTALAFVERSPPATSARSSRTARRSPPRSPGARS